MKTNVAIDLTDEERSVLANWIDDKRSKRLASRKDVSGLIVGLITGLLDQQVEVTLDSSTDEPEYMPGIPGTQKRPRWEDHPHLTKFADQIEAGLKRLRWHGTQHERGYRRGWTLTSAKEGKK